MVTVEADKEELNRQLEEDNLKNFIEVKFKFKPGYHLEKMDKELENIPVEIANKSQQHKIELFWDDSSISNLKKKSGRLIRKTDNMDETPQEQVNTTILPGQAIEAKLSDEKLVSPLHSKNVSVKKKSNLDSERLLKLEALTANNFHVQLVFNIADQKANPKDGKQQRFCVLRCPLSVKRVHWKKAADLLLRPKK
ncbi:MAG: hypothetical protein F6K36_02340 [Symploca sp. SIO3C6]|uniref:Uncharacterized protein n=1 Tax=Symploca sp. SIO1C4 TaxID=2607765 RepID=A0A6B3MY26_9CYAN|nr:hypothetical protein [Symploca sp. SIO3C6]NER26326.1 hypothetical protein [Symploca sp. SIO1C4]